MAEKKIAAAVKLLTEFESGADCSAGHTDGPCHPMIAFTLGNALMMQASYAQAAARYASAVEKDPGFASAWLNLARVRYETGRFQEAGKAFFQAYHTDENKRAETLYFAAASFLAGGNHEKALIAFQQIRTRHPGTMPLDWKESLVQVYLALKQPRPALPLVKSLAEQTDGKKQRQWQEVLLHQYLALEMRPEALDYARHLTEEQPEEPAWWKALAHLYLMENQYRNALIAMTVYGHLSPLPPVEKELMADLNMQLDIPARAAELYEEILAEKFQRSVIYKLAAAFRRMHLKDRALQWVEKSLSTAPDDKKLLLLRGDLLFELKRYGDAVSAYGIAAGANPEQGRAWLMMGYAAVHAGDMAIARKALGRAAAHVDQRKAARQALKQISGQ